MQFLFQNPMAAFKTLADPIFSGANVEQATFRKSEVLAMQMKGICARINIQRCRWS
ncbi:MAG TPA: hypothetical protein VJM08_11700 [Anaerolineales bacterium]|nr:hypothetical protein [Anaerolineales bacterium]